DAAGNRAWMAHRYPCGRSPPRTTSPLAALATGRMDAARRRSRISGSKDAVPRELRPCLLRSQDYQVGGQDPPRSGACDRGRQDVADIQLGWEEAAGRIAGGPGWWEGADPGSCSPTDVQYYG